MKELAGHRFVGCSFLGLEVDDNDDTTLLTALAAAVALNSGFSLDSK